MHRKRNRMLNRNEKKTHSTVAIWNLTLEQRERAPFQDSQVAIASHTKDKGIVQYLHIVLQTKPYLNENQYANVNSYK